MNKKIKIIVLVLLLMISATTSIMAATSLQNNVITPEIEQSEIPSTNSTNFENAIKTKNIMVPNTDQTVTKKIVSYVSSQKIIDDYTIDIYADSTANEYLFSASEELVGYNRHEKTVEEYLHPEKFTDRLQDKSEKSIIAYAEKFASNLYGDEFDGFVFERLQMLGTNIYYVLFELPAGKDNSIHVRRCTVSINKEGFIESSVLSQKLYNNDSDIEALDTIGKDDIVANVTKQLTEIFSDAREINVKKTYLAAGCDSLRVEAEFTTDLDITGKFEGYDYGFIDDNSYLIILYYPLS